MREFEVSAVEMAYCTCFHKLKLQTHVISESVLELFDLLGFVLLSDL